MFWLQILPEQIKRYYRDSDILIADVEAVYLTQEEGIDVIEVQFLDGTAHEWRWEKNPNSTDPRYPCRWMLADEIPAERSPLVSSTERR